MAIETTDKTLIFSQSNTQENASTGSGTWKAWKLVNDFVHKQIGTIHFSSILLHRITL